ncbi:hypothetical protein ACFORG_15505 [Lutimaribacter marinistellae]|uniref:AAA+ family ATPase n=1 Tax=Lutimaribacter marinistellae TaxID=1820329 RepID=A0ABV7TIP4_9RHOB
MKQFALSLALVAFSALPAIAQVEDEGDEKSLMEQGAELFFRGLREEMEPTMEELRSLAEEFGPRMQGFLDEMGPAMSRIMSEVEDWSTYEVPEMLPNGDIIIRKKQPKPEEDAAPEDDATPEGQIEL